jgi:uncharacterized membrane protein YphA (DoxX/SURF4 family)
MTIILWIFQVLLALLFVFAGVMKFVIPVDEMVKQMPVHFPGIFLHFIGVCEMLGGLGLILPSALRIKPMLTPLAAAGLAIITLGATIVTLMGGGIAPAVWPLVLCLLSIFIAYYRWRVVPVAEK